MRARFLRIQHHPGGLDDAVGANDAPVQARRIRSGRHSELTPSNHERAPADLQVALKAPVDGVVLEHVSQVLDAQEIIDGDYLNVVSLARRAKGHPTDATETIDADC